MAKCIKKASEKILKEVFPSFPMILCRTEGARPAMQSLYQG